MGAENTEYGADQIQILEGLEAVRKRPGMYIGSTCRNGKGICKLCKSPCHFREPW